MVSSQSYSEIVEVGFSSTLKRTIVECSTCIKLRMHGSIYDYLYLEIERKLTEKRQVRLIDACIEFRKGRYCVEQRIAMLFSLANNESLHAILGYQVQCHT